MSWIFGYAGPEPSRLSGLHDRPLFGLDAAGLYVRAGGLGETCFAGRLEGGERWFVVGIGIEARAYGCRFLEAADWKALLSPAVPDFSSIDGHFVAVRCRGGRVEAHTDPLGTRTLHLGWASGGVVFSTRLDWLAAACGGLEIDFSAFGSHWLTANQLSTRSQVRGIRRVGPGGRAVIENGNAEVRDRPWTARCDASDRDGRAFERTLSVLCRPEGGERVSLGLSGGLDSRLLLALRGGPTHTFGPADHPDVRISERIAEREGIERIRLHQELPDLDGCLALLEERAAQAQVTSPASAAPALRHYGALHARGLVTIDGGLGEAARRQFMNRLLRAGKRALLGHRAEAILPLIRFPRADVFSRDVSETMTRGALDEIRSEFRRLPIHSARTAEDAVDLLGIRSRLPNFFGFEQNRLDAVARCYMPFAQPSVLRAVFRVPVSLRRRGRLFRRIIRRNAPALARIPLAKDSVSYPYRLSGLAAWAFAEAGKKWGLAYRNAERDRFLAVVRPFVLDAAHSQDVRSCGVYDPARLADLVADYYGGNSGRAAEVDWWLSFEMWRRTLRTRT